MRRELLLIGQMIEAAEQARTLVAGIELADLEADRQRRDALLWNFTVLGEAATQLDGEVKARFPEISWAQPTRLRNRVVHGYWSIDLEILHTTAVDLLPAFVDQLRSALAALETDDEQGDLTAEEPSASEHSPFEDIARERRRAVGHREGHAEAQREFDPGQAAATGDLTCASDGVEGDSRL